ncbi:MAG TPA: hypothetical protein VM756_08270, partial [Burkholderiales bacterium]|nr:hypothetical protein [Burkholderiales bacterium]
QFQEGAMVAHQAALQTDIRNNIGRYVIEAPDDPDAFDAKVAGLSEGLLKDADPRTSSFIEQRIADYAGRAKLQVLDAQQTKLRGNAMKDLEVGSQGLFDDATTAAFEGDTTLTEARRQEITGLLERGTAAGLMAPAKATELLDSFERAVTSQEVVGNFDRLLRAQGSAAATEAIRSWQGQKASELGLSSDDHEAVTRQLITMKNRFDSLDADERAKQNALISAEQLARATRVKDAIGVMKSGFAPDKAQVDQATADIRWLRSSGIQNPTDAVQAAELARDFDVAAAIQGQVHTFRRMTETQRTVELGKLRGALTREGASADQVQLFKALENTHSEVTAAVKKDARGFLAGEGLIEQEPLKFDSSEALIESLTARGSGSELGRQLTGEPISRLTAAETDQFATLFQQSEIEERAGLLGILTAGAGEEAEATLKQIDSQGYKGLALLGNLVREGRGQLAREVMMGDKIRGSEKQITPKRTDYQADLNDALGAALIDWPEQRTQYVEAALSKYAELKARSGDASDTYEPKLFTQALEAVMPTGEFNDRKVLIPAAATPDSFEDWTQGFTDADFVDVAGRPDEGMAKIVKSRGRLVELGNGRYGVAINSASDAREKFLLNHQGEPFVLEYGKSGPRSEPARGRPNP